MLTLVIITTYIGSHAHAGGPWDNQYCNVEITKVKVVNEQGDVLENLTEENNILPGNIHHFPQNLRTIKMSDT